MKRSTKLIIVSGIAAAVVAGGATTIAVAQDGPQPSPDDLRAAGEAARAAVGDGAVVAVERDDDRDGYDVEIRRADGSEVDVDLSPTLEVVRTDDDRDRPHRRRRELDVRLDATFAVVTTTEDVDD
jgi:hypothetical protein